MHQLAGRRPSPAMVVALLALFVALSGVAWAAVELDRGSVRSKHLANGAAVKNKDVANDALQGDKINEATLAQVPSAVSANSAASATNASSAANADQLDSLDSADFLRANGKAADADLIDGLDRSALLRDTVTRRTVDGSVDHGMISGEGVECNPGEVAISGGVLWDTTPIANQTVLLESSPNSDATQWNVTVGNTSGVTKGFRAVAVCVLTG